MSNENAESNKILARNEALVEKNNEVLEKIRALQESHERIVQECKSLESKTQETDKVVDEFEKSFLSHSCGLINSYSTILNHIEESSTTLVNSENKSSSNKTQIVRPMIGGHVIERPKINITRISAEELARFGIHSQTNNVISTNEEHNDVQVDAANDRLLLDLETIVEESENTSPQTINTSRVSGIFYNVNVYLNPNDNNANQTESVECQPSTSGINSSSSPISASSNTVTIRKAVPSTSSTPSVHSGINLPPPSPISTASNNVTFRKAVPSTSSTPSVHSGINLPPPSPISTASNNVTVRKAVPSTSSAPSVHRLNNLEKLEAMKELNLTPRHQSSKTDSSSSFLPHNIGNRTARSENMDSLDSSLLNCTVQLERMQMIEERLAKQEVTKRKKKK